jgi:hypothetical protein
MGVACNTARAMTMQRALMRILRAPPLNAE